MLSDFEIKLYESVYNNGLGRSHLLKFKEEKTTMYIYSMWKITASIL